jgi:acyl carrier protein
MNPLETELKALIIECLGLEDIAPDDIDTDAPLFGDGLGLDSVDALELGLALQKRYGIAIDPETRNMRLHFASVANLAAFVVKQRHPA